MTPVTVLMPVYNGESYLERAIQSILIQTFENFKFLQRNFQYLPQLFIDGFAFSLDGNKLVIAITKNIARQNYKKKLSGKNKIYEFFGLGNYII